MKSKSEIITDFLQLLTDSQNEYQLAFAQVGIEDKLCQDLLHELELGETNTRNKTAKMLTVNRKDRRYYKNITEQTYNIFEFYKENRKTIEQLKQVLGKVRKAEEYHANRNYKPKVMVQGEIK